MTKQNQIDYKQIHKILYCGGPDEIYSEIRQVLNLVDPTLDLSFLDIAYKDILRLFNGAYPGYQNSKTRYHNLSHTCWVVLAMARLIHGHTIEGHIFSHEEIELGILTAFFHDTGLIQKDDEPGGTGAKFTIGHEERSIGLLVEYLKKNGKGVKNIESIRQIIQCTMLSLAPGQISFESEDTKLLGFILGSADLIAQMAERTYLEKLPLLFEEFQEGKVPGFDSSFDLFKKTESFYREIVLKRLHNDMDGVAKGVKSHFKVRHGLDRDLYEEAISNQIVYLKEITKKCKGSYECLLGGLRRKIDKNSNF